MIKGQFIQTPPVNSPAGVKILRWCRTNCLRAGAAMLVLNSAWAVNLAPLGRGIMGVNDDVDADAGVPYFHAGIAASINDGDVSSRVDNYFGDPPTDQGKAVSFVGIAWRSPRFETIQTLTLDIAAFFDGGWFGVNGVGPGAGGLLTADQLIEPAVQVSTNGGVSWTTVPHTSDYLSVMTGFGIGGGENPNPTQATTTFTLNPPVSNVDAIRIIGRNGGQADGNGFIGVFELQVEGTPGADTDNDGLPDAWESAYGLAVGTNDSATDSDGDGVTNADEFTVGTNPKQADTDGDGLSDAAELQALTDPGLADTDGDGLSDGAEVNTHKSDPLMVDTDADTLSDGAEVNTYKTNPTLQDTDNDGFPDNVEVAQGSDPTSASSIPNNVALQGVAILGVKDALDSGPETEVEYAHAGVVTSVNDGDPATRVDTYNGDTPTQVGYVGILWDNPITNRIKNVKLNFATFFDGGWFGPNGTGPGAGAALTANHLAEPSLEITLDRVTWVPVPFTSDYVAKLSGHRIGGGAVPNPSSVTATFTLNQETNNIMGVRLIGTEGGQASGGFLGIFELEVLSSSTDVDGDGLDDAWERQNGLVVGTNDSAADPDNDGLTNLQEFQAGTNPKVADTDGDALNDGQEINTTHTNPLQADTDTDGLSDGAEVNTHRTNPLTKDSDGDGFADGIEVGQGTDPANAANFPDNLAASGTAILGTRESLDSGDDIPVFNAGPGTAINDFDPLTRVDTFNGGGPETVSFVGILWDQPVTNPVQKLELTLATFFDGGWFGVNGVGPGSGGVLSASEHLVEPIVQVSTNKGATWEAVPFTSDYVEALTDHPLPAADFGPPTSVTATFELTTPQSGINGVRIIGTEGGTASGGFLGVFELAVRGAGSVAGSGVQLGSVNAQPGTFQFQFDSAQGKSYVVQFKNSLSDASWQTLSTIPGDGTRKTVTDNRTAPTRFYRVSTQ